MAMGQNVVVLY